MANRIPTEIGPTLWFLWEEGTTIGLTDRELIERFLTREDDVRQWSFQTIVERHGPMMLRVCREILRDNIARRTLFKQAS